MNEKEAKEMLYTLVANNCRGNDDEYIGSYEQAFDIVIDLLEQKDKRIDDLEKALIEEQLKHTDKINKTIKYIEEETCIDYEREICHEMYEGQIFELIKILEE